MGNQPAAVCKINESGGNLVLRCLNLRPSVGHVTVRKLVSLDEETPANSLNMAGLPGARKQRVHCPSRHRQPVCTEKCVAICWLEKSSAEYARRASSNNGMNISR